MTRVGGADAYGESQAVGALAPRPAAPRAGSVEWWALHKPDTIAVTEGDTAMTWAELNDAANRLADGLQSHGVVSGDLVAVRTQIRIDWLIVNAALGKLQCVLLGVNWRLTAAELEQLLRVSGATTLLCDDVEPYALHAAALAAGIKLLVSLDVPAAGFVDYRQLLALPAVVRFSTADTPLVIYTSGTTGQPRGVLLGRRAADPPPSRELLEYVESVARSIPKCEHDVILVAMPLSHGSAPAQIRRCIQAGGRIALLRRFTPEQALELTDRQRITAWVMVPTMLNRMAALGADVTARYDLSSLQSIQVGAAPIAPSIKNWLVQQFGSEILHESYGSTEAGMVTHLPPQMLRHKPTSCGKPYRHVQVSIRDTSGATVPSGSVGEIWVKSPAVIDRYFNEPPLAREVLDEQGFLRTGDIGRLDEDGYLYITDRAKDMIVSGGVNIYPAEVEAALLAHPAVQDAAVIGIPDAEFGEQVKAFVELKAGSQAAPIDLLNHVRQKLAAYKLPKSIEFVDELPRTVTGKVLKRELRAPFWAGRERAIV